VISKYTYSKSEIKWARTLLIWSGLPQANGLYDKDVVKIIRRIDEGFLYGDSEDNPTPTGLLNGCLVRGGSK
jgi:hypothetical protein